MQLLLLSLVLHFCTGLDIIADGSFDGVGTWNITPPVGLCRGWCHGSNVWKEPAHTGLNFIFANPSEGSVYVSQRLTQPNEEYNRCELLVYLRVVNVLDSQVLVSWDSQEYQFDLLEWEKDNELSESEWTQAKLLLYGTSDEIKFRLQTESITYISMDDVSLTCYKVEFYENPAAQLLIFILIALIAATLSIIVKISNLDIACCCNRCQKVRFEPIEEEEEELEFDGFPLTDINTENLEKAVDGEGKHSVSSSSSSSTHTMVERQ